MTHPTAVHAGPVPRKHRRLFVAVVTLVVAAIVLLALVFVPANSSAKEIQVTSATGTTATLNIPVAGWVTVHFSHPSGTMSMRYWMQGPGGMMFDHSMMGGADSYSFWSWGGAYECGAGYAGSGYGPMSVWVNATWGIL